MCIRVLVTSSTEPKADNLNQVVICYLLCRCFYVLKFDEYSIVVPKLDEPN